MISSDTYHRRRKFAHTSPLLCDNCTKFFLSFCQILFLRIRIRNIGRKFRFRTRQLSNIANHDFGFSYFYADHDHAPRTTHHAPACPKTQRTKKTACKARNKKLLPASLFFIGFNPMPTPMPMAIFHSPPPHMHLYLRNGARRCTAHGLEVFTVSACSPLPSRGLRVCAPSSPPGPTLLVLHRSIIDH